MLWVFLRTDPSLSHIIGYKPGEKYYFDKGIAFSGSLKAWLTKINRSELKKTIKRKHPYDIKYICSEVIITDPTGRLSCSSFLTTERFWNLFPSIRLHWEEGFISQTETEKLALTHVEISAHCWPSFDVIFAVQTCQIKEHSASYSV